jgi:carboxynorspermidine decarboxylase
MRPWTNQLCNIPTPCYLVSEPELERNLMVIESIKNATGCNIILALKGFATHALFPQMAAYLDGVTASSVYESRLGAELFKKPVHGYSVGLSNSDCYAMNQLCNALSFNSLAQMALFNTILPDSNISKGLRINPMISSVSTPLYNPCAPYSRLGIPIDTLDPSICNTINGLHFHALCEQNVDALFPVLDAIEIYFSNHLHALDWINWGGGHHITRDDYDCDALIERINYWQNKYDLTVILEPGEAIGLHCGYYVTRVLDIVHNEMDIAICDISATAHMPDVLEYPYRPDIDGAFPVECAPYVYKIAGNTCLAGDIIGDYAFNAPLTVGQHLVFTDMGHYTLVKTTNFNGVNQPSVGIINRLDEILLKRQSSYQYFKEPLS